MWSSVDTLKLLANKRNRSSDELIEFYNILQSLIGHHEFFQNLADFSEQERIDVSLTSAIDLFVLQI